MGLYCVPESINTLCQADVYDVAWETKGQLAVSALYECLVEWKARETGQRMAQESLTFSKKQKAISSMIRLIQRKEIRVSERAFNNHPHFMSKFMRVGLGMATPTVLYDRQAIERVGELLNPTEQRMCITNIMGIQESVHGSFGSYVHRFVRKEMEPFDDRGQDWLGNYHFFYVWRPDTDWHKDFEEREAENPLGDSFGGYHHELSTLCLHMRTDKAALRDLWGHGHKTVFHLLIPAFQPIVVDAKFRFHSDLFPLIVTGAKHQGINLVWLALRQGREYMGLEPLRQYEGHMGVQLRSVSVLPEKLDTLDRLLMSNLWRWVIVVVFLDIATGLPFYTLALAVAMCTLPPPTGARRIYRYTHKPFVKVLGEFLDFEDSGSVE
ncbi:hypothetical protein FSST1_006305 [Fusarium sambucinum]